MKSATATASLLLIILISSSTVHSQDYYSDQGKTIEAQTEKAFTITLESNRTTGYEWQLAPATDETIVKFISCEYIPARTGLIGSGGREIWTFIPLRPGRTSIGFVYTRPWEKDNPPAKKSVFTINVT